MDINENELHQKSINTALDIIKSNRIEKLKERVIWLNENPDKCPHWKLQVFSGLLSKLLFEYDELNRTVDKDVEHIGVLALHTRNLLEISIWTIYCVENENNARSFYADAGKDGMDMLNNLEKWATKTPEAAGLLDSIPEAKDKLRLNAKKHSVESIDDSYIQVGNIAEKLGLGSHYRMAFKTLSKFAHPTAFLIIFGNNTYKLNEFKELFYSQGCMFFYESFNRLEQYILNTADEELN